MLARRVLLASALAVAIPAIAAGKKRKKPKKKARRTQKSKAQPKPKADSTLSIMRDLALHHVHSWDQEGMPIPELVAKYRAGETLLVICGSISAVGVQVLRDAGYHARVVGVVTQQPFNGTDGHIMLEVWQQGGWRLYDIDGNRRAVDASGNGVNIISQVEAGANRLWEAIADDPRWPVAGEAAQAADPVQAALDQRVFGTPWILLQSNHEAFHDATDRARLQSELGHVYVDAKTWKRLLGKP